MRCVNRLFSRFVRSPHAVAMIEFALILPLLLLLFGGVIEMTRYVLAHQKVDKAANSLADFLAQQGDPADFPIGTLDAAFDKLIAPFDTTTSGFRVTGVSLQNPNDNASPPVIRWQESRGTVSASRVGGAVGANANIQNIQLQGSEQLVVAEVYYRHSSVIDSIGAISTALDFDGEELYKQALTIQRVPVTPTRGTPQAMVQTYGCCGEYCRQGDPLNANDTDWLPSCACMRFPLCEYLPTHSLYNEKYPDFLNFPGYPNVTRGQYRKFILDTYGCRNSGPCADPPPDPCVAAGNCPPDPPCEPADSCACDPNQCGGGV